MANTQPLTRSDIAHSGSGKQAMLPIVEDNPLSRLTSVVLNGNNYQYWARLITLALSGLGKVDYINGEIKPPTETEITSSKYQEWQMNDSLVLSWILHSIEPSISELFIYSETALDLWNSLKEMYGIKHKYLRIFQLKQELAQIKQGGRSVTELVGQLMCKWNELAIYQPPTTDLKIIQQRIEEEKIFQFLAALNSSYEAVRTQILLSSELPSFYSVIGLVQREEVRLRAMNREQETVDWNLLLSDNRGDGKSKQLLRCSHCNRNGHEKSGCWFLHPQLRPSRERKSSGYGGNGGGRYIRKGGDSGNQIWNAGEPITLFATCEPLQRFGQAQNSGQPAIGWSDQDRNNYNTGQSSPESGFYGKTPLFLFFYNFIISAALLAKNKNF